MIHCTLCFHDSGGMHKAVWCALRSLFAHASDTVHVHVLTDETANAGRPHLEKLCADTGNRITFYGASVPRDIVAMFPGGTVGNYTEASLYRMCLHEVLPDNVEKVVYFDFDVIFERDVAHLWGMDPGNAWMIAAHDPQRIWSARKKRYYLKALGIEERRYFNSGVLLMNLKALRQASRDGGNVFWKAYRAQREAFARLPFPVFDQDLLNFMLSRDRERLLLVDPSFNYELCLFDRRFLRLGQLQGKILHFPSLKPWQKFFPAQLAYWKYFAQSPWASETFPLIEERMFDPKDRIWPFLMWVWRRHESFRWLARLRGSR